MILLTGGAGYIGSHMAMALAQAGLPVVIFDNFSNSQRGVLQRMAQISGSAPTVVEGDVRDAQALDRLFAQYPISAVVHFAGLKAVGESVAQPALYYDNNVAGSISLVRAMERAGVKQLVFSSSATVYGDPAAVPVPESAAVAPANPYGWTKQMVENILRDVAAADPAWRIACLRYFNPVGAHPSGLIGEDPLGMPNNLMPFIAQVASGRRPLLSIFGNDYPTPDGTGVRDYIHVMDLVEGHVAALNYLDKPQLDNFLLANLGTGQGISVLEMVKAFVQYTGQAVPYQMVARRPGDVAKCFADPGLAQRVLGWGARRGLKEMCADTWRWQCTQSV
jgi:UDP-glucose 4-epimerase